MPRPFWSGQIQISLVSFGVRLFPATEARSEIHFNQLSRKTGQRVHHKKVSGDEDTLEKGDIVKGYEYRKGEYVIIEPEDIEHLRIPSRHALAVEQFVDAATLDPELFEKPYFVTPDGDNQAEAFAVVRKALATTGKAALGKIAFGGREHLVAITAPQDEKQPGMMAYTLRYAAELRDPKTYFADIRHVTVDADQLDLAKELIKRKSSAFDPAKYTDDYEAALKAMVEAKVNKQPLPKDEPAPKFSNIVSLMDALRKSIRGDETPAKKQAAEPAKGPQLVKSKTPKRAPAKAAPAKATARRKSA